MLWFTDILHWICTRSGCSHLCELFRHSSRLLQMPGRRFTYCQEYQSATVDQGSQDCQRRLVSTSAPPGWSISWSSPFPHSKKPDEARVEELKKVKNRDVALTALLHSWLSVLHVLHSRGGRTSFTATFWGRRFSGTSSRGVSATKTLTSTANRRLSSARCRTPSTSLVRRASHSESPLFTRRFLWVCGGLWHQHFCLG